MKALKKFSKFRKRLFEIRKVRYSDARDLAAQIGVNDKKYRGFEGSGPLPSIEEAIRICQVLRDNDLFKLWLIEHFEAYDFFPFDIGLIVPENVEETELAQIVVRAHKEVVEAKGVQEDLFIIAADNKVTADEISRFEKAVQEFKDLVPIVRKMQAWEAKHIKKEAAYAAG